MTKTFIKHDFHHGYNIAAMTAAVDSWATDHANVFIGPEAQCKSVAQFAASRNIPIISHVSHIGRYLHK